MSSTDFNLYAHFDQRMMAQPDKELLCTSDGRSFSNAEIEKLSARIANYLAALGATRGDRVSVQVEKSPEFLCLYLACLRSGLVFHPLNLGYKKSELEYFIGNAEPFVIVCDPSSLPMISAIAQHAGTKQVLTMGADGAGTLFENAASYSEVFSTIHSDANDLAALLYSSGTTGVPKGIMLTHANLLRNTEALVAAWGFSAEDRLLHALPVFHVHGLFVAIGCVMLSGASMRWLPTFDVEEIIRFLPECTVFMGVPTYYTRLLTAPTFTAETAAAVRLFVSGSAPLLEETFNDFESRTGQKILERYGMTETNMNTSNPLNGDRKPGTVGPPLPGVEIRITGDDGTILETGEIGNLQVRGPNVFVGYWKMPEKTAEDFTADGFFNTGDKALVDSDGYISIVGRTKDMVITGGLNVYPKEIELFIDNLDGVKESAVFGVPDADFGEAVVAAVVKERDSTIEEAEIRSACKQELANFKVPKRIVLIDELPRNTMAKVQKNVLRDRYQDIMTKAP